MIWKAKRGRLRQRQRCQGGAGAPLPHQRGDPRGRVGQRGPAGLRQQNRLFPALVPSGSGRAKPLPPRPGPTELRVTPEHRHSKGPYAPLGAGTAGLGGRAKGGQGDTPRREGQLGALIALWGTQSTPPPHTALLAASASPLGHPKALVERWGRPSSPGTWLHFDTGPIPAPPCHGSESVGCRATEPPSLTPKAAGSPQPPPALARERPPWGEQEVTTLPAPRAPACPKSPDKSRVPL